MVYGERGRGHGHRIQVERQRRKALCLSTGPNTGRRLGRVDLFNAVMAQNCQWNAKGDRRQYARKNDCAEEIVYII